MEIRILHTLTNGALDALGSDPSFVSWILGALDKGFSVTWPGCIKAKKNKVEVITHTQGKERRVYIFHGKEKVFEIEADQFNWGKVTHMPGALYYNNQFITKTK